MPTYNFRNIETDEEFEIVMKISELDDFKKDNPNLQQFLTKGPSISYQTQSFNAKVPDWHKDNMKEMKKIHPLGNYGTID
jgi:predicted RNase H-like nuclease